MFSTRPDLHQLRRVSILKKACWARQRMVSSVLPIQSDQTEADVPATTAKRTSPEPAVQTIPFTDLPPEIRNRVYQYTLPDPTQQLLVASPTYDDLVCLGDQPALTKICRFVRSETLPMFYGHGTFVTYVDNFDFNDLIDFCTVVSGALASFTKFPPLMIKVTLLNPLHCIYQLLDFARQWRDVRHELFHLQIFRRDGGRVLYDNRYLVVKAVDIAERCKRMGLVTETDLLNAFSESTEMLVASRGLGCSVCRFGRDWTSADFCETHCKRSVSEA